MYDTFKNWLNNNTTLSAKSISNYGGALNKITRDLITENLIFESLEEIKTAEQVQETKKKYFAIDTYKKQDIKAKNMYHAGFNKYILFRESTEKKQAAENWFNDKVEVLSSNKETAKQFKNVLKKRFLNP
tara:strand:+ start:49 stop:438 length:390 start_codon:yes stop_codon:yes gene_type:complete